MCRLRWGANRSALRNECVLQLRHWSGTLESLVFPRILFCDSIGSAISMAMNCFLELLAIAGVLTVVAAR